MIQASIKSPKLTLEKYWVFLNKPGLMQEPICNHSWLAFYSYQRLWCRGQHRGPEQLQLPHTNSSSPQGGCISQRIKPEFPSGKLSEGRTETCIAFHALQYPVHSHVELKEWVNKWVLLGVLTKQLLKGTQKEPFFPPLREIHAVLLSGGICSRFSSTQLDLIQLTCVDYALCQALG